MRKIINDIDAKFSNANGGSAKVLYNGGGAQTLAPLEPSFIGIGNVTPSQRPKYDKYAPRDVGNPNSIESVVPGMGGPPPPSDNPVDNDIDTGDNTGDNYPGGNNNQGDPEYNNNDVITNKDVSSSVEESKDNKSLFIFAGVGVVGLLAGIYFYLKGKEQ